MAMVRRVIRAHGRRVIHADPEDLAELVALRAVVDQAITDAVRGMRAEHGRSWSDIGRASARRGRPHRCATALDFRRADCSGTPRSPRHKRYVATGRARLREVAGAAA